MRSIPWRFAPRTRVPGSPSGNPGDGKNRYFGGPPLVLSKTMYGENSVLTCHPKPGLGWNPPKKRVKGGPGSKNVKKRQKSVDFRGFFVFFDVFSCFLAIFGHFWGLAQPIRPFLTPPARRGGKCRTSRLETRPPATPVHSTISAISPVYVLYERESKLMPETNI